MRNSFQGRPRRPAHPRSRVEHGSRVSMFLLARGSSPLARGTWVVGLVAIWVLRLIPARAGNMCVILDTIDPLAAHPRSRGEHCRLGARADGSLGSSPLARGTCYGHDASSRPGRLIPARAGNISCAFLPARLAAAHPRSRGEHRVSNSAAMPVDGSSPLARGTCGM